MRLTKFALASLIFATLAFSSPAIRAQDTGHSSKPLRGTAPRSSADKYKTHASHECVSAGAELLTRKQVSKEFAADVNRCCLVVLVAVYPKQDEPLELSLDDFALTPEGSDNPVRPQSATVISAKLEKKSSPAAVTATTGVGVGYESGTYTDPTTGQTVHARGVSTSVSTGVGIGNTVPAATSEHDREVIEHELAENSLPEAKISVPVSGYLYFSLPKRAKNAKYRLEYTVKGEPLTLHLP